MCSPAEVVLTVDFSIACFDLICLGINSSKVAFFLLPLYPLAIGGPREYILFPPTNFIHSRAALLGRLITRGGG
jgi:hypothetical protein